MRYWIYQKFQWADFSMISTFKFQQCHSFRKFLLRSFESLTLKKYVSSCFVNNEAGTFAKINGFRYVWNDNECIFSYFFRSVKVEKCEEHVIFMFVDFTVISCNVQWCTLYRTICFNVTGLQLGLPGIRVKQLKGSAEWGGGQIKRMSFCERH